MRFFAALKRQAREKGLTGNPVCPTCEQPVEAKQWDEHQKQCGVSKTPR